MSLLLLFPSSGPATQAGFYSLMARWMGGAGALVSGNRRRRFFCGSIT
jgi:hypothetical protein